MFRAVALLLMLAAAGAARAQIWPARAVEVVVPFAAGGGTDPIARVLTEQRTESLHQRFIVINRPGAST